jgi:hypothetical protein
MEHMDDDIERVDDEDITWVDPAIRRDYEAALGRFMLAYK